MDNFFLHPQLAGDTLPVGDLHLCRVLLMNNQIFPWLILVPRKPDLREIFDLSPEDYTACMEEIRHVSHFFSTYAKADKMNIAALGNTVPQLHIHIIARFKNDAAWPNPVWSCGIKTEPYSGSDAQKKLLEIYARLNITNL